MAGRPGQGEDGTRARILDVAERLVQTRGFNAFSYADVAAELRLTKPALHYHFAGKGELGEALVARYVARFTEALHRIDRSDGDGQRKLEGYAALYAHVVAEDRMCLCGMLAAEYHTLPVPMRDSVLRFFDQNEDWLEGVLAQGAQEGSLRFSGTPLEAARLILASLEGALLVARSFEDPARFESAAAGLLAGLTETEPSD